jgi:hypothetical protein
MPNCRNPFCGIALSILLLVVPVKAARADLPFFDFSGYSYVSGPPAQVGTIVTVAAKFNGIQPNPSWPLDLVNNEYTVMIQDLAVAAVNSYGPFQEITYAGGTITIHVDAAKNAAWAANPPNGQTPATFLDGDLALVGSMTDMILFYDTSTGTGTVSGLVNWAGGARRDALQNPVGWTFFGMVSSEAGLGIPAGYDLAWDPQLYGPERSNPVVPKSWGGVKHAFSR